MEVWFGMTVNVSGAGIAWSPVNFRYLHMIIISQLILISGNVIYVMIDEKMVSCRRVLIFVLMKFFCSANALNF